MTTEITDLDTAVAEALAEFERASRIACNTTAEEGYTLEQWQAAQAQADAAQKYYYTLYAIREQRLASVKTSRRHYFGNASASTDNHLYNAEALSGWEGMFIY